MSFNKIIVVGNLGRDPELRYTAQGTPVCSFSMATNERRKDQNGEMQDHTTWFRITLWNRLAETASQYLQKGKQVYIEGRCAWKSTSIAMANRATRSKCLRQICSSSDREVTTRCRTNERHRRARVQPQRIRKQICLTKIFRSDASLTIVLCVLCIHRGSSVPQRPKCRSLL